MLYPCRTHVVSGVVPIVSYYNFLKIARVVALYLYPYLLGSKTLGIKYIKTSLCIC